MKLLQKLLLMCVILTVLCVPSSAEDVVIDTSFIAYGRANLIVNVEKLSVESNFHSPAAICLLPDRFKFSSS